MKLIAPFPARSSLFTFRKEENKVFTKDEEERYSRHIILPQIGKEGQAKLKEAKVLVVGTGGLGSPVDYYLAAAGVGTLGIIDGDVVDTTNLQRQLLHSTKDVGRIKVDSAEEKLKALNPNTKIVKYKQKVDSSNVLGLIEEYDIVVDCTDNFPARFLLNDACYLKKKPLVHGAIIQFDGQAITILPGESACYRCVYHEPPSASKNPDSGQLGLIGSIPGIIGAIQATEVIKLVTGIGKLLTNRLLVVDALNMNFNVYKRMTDPNCPLCGENPTLKGLVDYEKSTNADI